MPSYRDLLRDRTLRALMAATAWSRLANRMFTVLIVLYALQRFHSPELAGWVGFASMAPGMLVSPIAGALLDRMGALRCIAIDLAASALLIAALAALEWQGLVSQAGLLGLTAVYSLTSPLSTAGIRALLPRLVPAAARDRANALDTTCHGIVDVVGPLLAGPLIAFAGALPSFSLVALLYALATYTLTGQPEPAAPATPRSHLLIEAATGLAAVLRHKTLRGLAVAYALNQAGWGILLVAVPVFVATKLGAGPATDSTVGALWAIAGLAGSIGALAAGAMGIMHRERHVLALGSLLGAVTLYPLGPSFGLIGLAAALVVLNGLAGPIDVAVLTLRQRRTDPGQLGRVMAVSMSLNMCGTPIGAAIGGILLTHSITATFIAAALAGIAAAAASVTFIASD